MSIVIQRAVTSASNISRRRACPGSARLEVGLSSPDTKYSEEGQMLHELFMTGRRPLGLTPEQSTVLDQSDFYGEEIISAVRDKFYIPEDARFIDEREVPLMFENAKGEELFPGHADLIRTYADYSVRVILDAKFGFMEVEEATDNDQLACYAAMRQQRGPVEHTCVGIIQPRNFGPRYSQAIYTADSLVRAMRDLEQVDADSKKPNAPLVPGLKQCHFCQAKSICEAYKEKFVGIEKVTRDVAVSSLSNPDLERVHMAIAFAAKLKDEVSAEMRARITEGTIQGWKLQNAGEQSALTDELGFFTALKDHFKGNPAFTVAGYDACRKLSWGDLWDYLKKVSALPDKKLDNLIRELSEKFAVRTPITKRIVRDKTAALK